jgi:hypothetical protein
MPHEEVGEYFYDLARASDFLPILYAKTSSPHQAGGLTRSISDYATPHAEVPIPLLA